MSQTDHFDLEQVRADQSVQELLDLTTRLRQASGGDLDDASLLAISEATGTPIEYVRLAASKSSAKNERETVVSRYRGFILSLDPKVRSLLVAGYLACGIALLTVVAAATNERFGLAGMAQILMVMAMFYHLFLQRNRQLAAAAGAVFGGAIYASASVFCAIAALFVNKAVAPEMPTPFLMIPLMLVGALAGTLMSNLGAKFRPSFGIKDNLSERQELLQQLVQIQDKLSAHKSAVSFLSLDVVGSTRLKAASDPLDVEFTFTEYHRFVEQLCKRHGGQLHSTAGDGITMAFNQPTQAFAAARNIQSGIFELNAMRNKLREPLVLRAGIHHGDVVAPSRDVQDINFAHVIDIAAHLQKLAPEGGIVVSEAAAKLMAGGSSNVGTDMVEAHDVKGFVWRPRMAAPKSLAANRPPAIAPEAQA